ILGVNTRTLPSRDRAYRELPLERHAKLADAHDVERGTEGPARPRTRPGAPPRGSATTTGDPSRRCASFRSELPTRDATVAKPASNASTSFDSALHDISTIVHGWRVSPPREPHADGGTPVRR